MSNNLNNIYGIIYKCTNIVNGKIYIGQTINTLEKRIIGHIHNIKHKSNYFHNALNKYGQKNFIWEIIDEAFSKDELDLKEIRWIKYYNSFGENGYNLTSGGSDNFKVSKSLKNKQSNRSKLYWDNNLNRHRNNNNWSIDELKELYKSEHPDWNENKCMKKAEMIFKEIHHLNNNYYYNATQFHSHTIPFSFSKMLEDEDFEGFKNSDIYSNLIKCDYIYRNIDSIIQEINNDDLDYLLDNFYDYDYDNEEDDEE